MIARRVAVVSTAVALSVVGSTLSAPLTTAQPVKKPTPVSAARGSHAIPATGSTVSGQWTLWSPSAQGASRSVIQMPATQGTPLLADWDGDGVATPGRYSEGEWSFSDSAVKSGTWQSFGRLGGAPGDIPVTGNLSKDPRTDIGVFNAGAWQWQLSTGATTTMEFGAAGDIPVVGDWDGNGRDDIGVVRGTTWILLVTNVATTPKFPRRVQVDYDPGAQVAVLTFTFGNPGDRFLAGDWNGDGAATPVAIDPQSRWTFMLDLNKPKRTTTATYPISADALPLVGLQATSAGDCPTATSTAVTRGTKLARTVVRARTPQGTRKIAGNQEILATLRDGLGYVITNDKTKRLRAKSSMPFTDALNTERNEEESIRRSANSALAAAILLSTMKNPKVTRVSNRELVNYTRWQIRSIACQHAANSNNGWGNTWQSALWAVTTGQAAWLIWKDLSRNERAMVSTMITAEADAAASRGPRYFRDRAGKELTPGDSQSDEVSWDMLAPALATAMFPRNAHARVWKESAIAMSIAAFARPGDLTNDRTVNGVNVNLRLPGTNANEDGTVTNHGIVNPDYTQNVQHLWWAATALRAGNQAVPESFFFNADIVYRALAVVNFDSPPYAAPGGTVYQPGGQIYYPMGKSWGTRRPATFVGVDGFANVYSAPDTNAATFLAAHAYDTRGMQQRFTTGAIYAPGNEEDSYKLGKEEYALQQLALAWWAGAWKFGPRMNLDTKAYPAIRLDSGYPL